MNELTTEIIAALAQKQDLDEVFRHHLEIAINQLLQTELAEFLGYERYSYAGINTGNNRNGSYERSFDTKYGQLNLTIPRDCNGRFENHTLPAYRNLNDRLNLVQDKPLSATDLILTTLTQELKPLSRSELTALIPQYSDITIKRALSELKKSQRIKLIGKEKSSKYILNN
ncbi:Transposase [Lactiplantibacillus plantarum]|nr:Transposase [Lactiplantibacillus plantarum]